MLATEVRRTGITTGLLVRAIELGGGAHPRVRHGVTVVVEMAAVTMELHVQGSRRPF